jgi:XTP/dITP diphosphohydrolase
MARGECRGTIGFDEIGDGGFGYDPLFFPVEYNGEKTMAQLTAEEKDAISHRGKAVREIAAQIGENN